MSRGSKSALDVPLMDETWDSSEYSAPLTILRCRKCRKCLAESTCLLSIGNSGELSTTCSVWHMNVDTLPDWIQSAVHQARWTVGKLNCPFCGARLGGFNFVNCSRCPCGHEDVVHISKSRVDHESKCTVYPLRPLRAWGRAGRTDSQDELRDPEGERMVRGSSEGCLPDPQSSCPAILRLIGTSTPIAPPHRLGAEAEWTDSQAALPDGSSQSLTGFCGISGLSCFGESSLQRFLDLAEVETVGEVRPNSEQDSPAPLAGLSPPLSPPLEAAADAAISQAELRGSSELPTTLHSGQQQHLELLVGDAMLPEVLLHEAPRLPSIPGSRVPSDRTDGEEEEEEEEWAVAPRVQDAPPNPPRSTAAAECQLSKREKNRLKSQRRKQRRRERWLRSQLEESQLGFSPLGSEDEEEREGHTCAVCLDVYFSPHMCQPCGHVFCEPCLRTLAKNRPGSTPCPLCRTVISHVLFQKELNQTAKTFFPKEYLSRKQTFQKANYAKWPLPHCPKRFRIFWGFQRDAARGGRWQFPNRPFGLDALDLVDMRAWPFDIDLVIIYVYSIHWILAFLILCFVGYCFFF
ncbi:E3 ubiquitin-protein ligase RNF180 isoform X2 [Clupea harengus]|uniref:E3 ubiquitin-protein ligase RNF180 n=1 Tax=Clupea harengus TaxID=7950 RepID=A0A6P3VHF9_CLUHA|nr:E3 ubiquitin-protein ligase RNF180 isoform X2 [Clupea harengus]